MLYLFDLDGTLADTREAFQQAFDEAARAINVQSFRRNDEEYLRTLEASDVLRAHGIAAEQFGSFTQFLKEGMAKRESHVQLVSGMGEALDALSGHGIRLGLLTSNAESLARAVLADRISLFTHCQFDVALHAKESALTQAASEGTPRYQLRYFGDEIRDWQAALAADVPFTAMTWGYNTEASLRTEGCTSFVRHPDELVSGSFVDNHSDPGSR